METLSYRENINRLIRKIQNDWERANKKDAGFSRIDKDILMDDLKKVYDLVYELETIKVFRDSPVVENISVEKLNTENEEAPFQQSPVDLEIVRTDEKKPEQKPEAEKVQQQIPSYQKTKAEPQAEKNTPLDLFSATKTLADIYQNDKDDSLAAKIKNDKITDIKTVIGINDKFLFINDIFKGEMSAYNSVIKNLNLTTNFNEALQIIDELKSTTGTVENKTTFNKLLEIAKRRFH